MPWVCWIAAWVVCEGATSKEKALLLRGSQPVLLSAPSCRSQKRELSVFPVIGTSTVANGSLDQLVSCPHGL